MPDVVINAGPFRLTARYETVKAPRTCASFRRLLPFKQQLVHVRWSGEALWVPLGDLDLGISAENATSYPLVGQILLYPGGISETELLMPYGSTHFASKAGELAGNHFLTIETGIQDLVELGRLALWEGAQPIFIDAAR